MFTDPDNDQYHNIMHILRLQSLEQTLFFAAVFVCLCLKSNGHIRVRVRVIHSFMGYLLNQLFCSVLFLDLFLPPLYWCVQ